MTRRRHGTAARRADLEWDQAYAWWHAAETLTKDRTARDAAAAKRNVGCRASNLLAPWSSATTQDDVWSLVRHMGAAASLPIHLAARRISGGDRKSAQIVSNAIPRLFRSGR